MDIHRNARLKPHSRAVLVRRGLYLGQTPKAVAMAFGVCERTARKWIGRYRAETAVGLANRSSRPRRLRCPTPAVAAPRIAALRPRRWAGRQIAGEVGVSPATVNRILRRLGLSKLKALEPAAPVRRYQSERPGELIHIDIKKLGRFSAAGHHITGDRAGEGWGADWESVHVCIDDNSRLAFVQVRPDERKESAVAFLEAAVAYYASLGVPV